MASDQFRAPSHLPSSTYGEGVTAGKPVEQLPTEGQDSKAWRYAFMAVASLAIVFVLAAPLVFAPLSSDEANHYSHYFYLARNLVQGHLWVDGLPATDPDWVQWNGHMYLPLGPLPAVALIPFLPLLEAGLPVVWISHLFTLLNIFMFYRILSVLGLGSQRIRWACMLFFGGTAYYTAVVLGSSWMFAHIITTTLLLAAVLESLGRRRPLVMGLLLGLAGMSRMTALFALPFFVWMIWRWDASRHRSVMNTKAIDGNEDIERDKAEVAGRSGIDQVNLNTGRRRMLGSTLMLLLGVAGPVFLLGLYNYLRFGSALDSGYAHAVLLNPTLREALSYGLFSIVHIPKNLFMMLLQGPLPWPSESAGVLEFPYVVPSHWGMGLFFTTPALVYAFLGGKARLKSPLIQAAWLAVAFVMVPVITYYGIGWVQFGFRYALDFLPFLIIITACSLPSPMTPRAKVLIIISVLVNVWGCIFLTAWT